MAVSEPNPEVLAAMHALFRALGEPQREPISGPEADRYDGSSATEFPGLHPIFPLAETFTPGDRGYTDNGWSSRGGHMSLPGFDENGDIVVIDTGFHKGGTFMEKVTYAASDGGVHSALYQLLKGCEERD
jgi:hypothetical protein